MSGPIKISELPEANSSSGAVIIPVLQDGITKKITLSTLIYPNSITATTIGSEQVTASEISDGAEADLRTSIAASLDPAAISAASVEALEAVSAIANAAKASADNKVSTFYQINTPTPTGIGDIWIHPNTHITRRSSDGVTFDQVVDLIVNGSINASKLSANSITSEQLSAATLNAIKISAAQIDTGSIVTDVLTSLNITSDKIGANTILSNNIKANNITAEQIKTNSINASKIVSGSITANEISTGTITANEMQANTITAREIDSCSITASLIDSDAITTRHIGACAVTATNIATGSIGAGSIVAGAIGTQALETGAILTGNLKSENSDIQITQNSNTAEYIFNLGTQGFYLHGPTGTIVANTIIARNNIISGNMIKFDETLGGLSTDVNGNIAVATDGDTLKVENGQVVIKTVPSNAVVNAYKDLNYLGAHNGKAHQTITATVSNRLSRGINNGYDGTDVGFMKIAVVDLLSFGNNINLGEIGRGTLNNLTFEIDPRGLSQLGAFASGGNEFQLFIVARYASTDNDAGTGNSAISQAGNFIAKPFGDKNPVIPNAPFEIEMEQLRLGSPPNSISRYLHIHTVIIAGNGGVNGAVQINDTISLGIKPSLNSYVSWEVTGDQSGIDLARPMTEFLNSTDVNGNPIGDYVPLT